MDLALNNLQRLICHKTQETNQSSHKCSKCCGDNNYDEDASPNTSVYYQSTLGFLNKYSQ